MRWRVYQLLERGKKMKCEIKFDQDNGSIIEWISNDTEIENLVPFIQSIHCDGGEEIEELYGDDFSEISLDDFRAHSGEDEGTFILCYKASFEFDEKTFSTFKSALDYSSNQIEIKLGFKDKSGEELDTDDLYEGHTDTPTEITVI